MKNLNPQELISIISPVFNNVKDIESCLMSVAYQTYTLKEHWVIDGGSTDGTLEIIQQYAQQYHHIKWISEKDDGIYNAMNKGIEKAKGDWLYFLGSDDQLINETIIEEVFDNPRNLDYDILYGNILLKETNKIYGESTDINKLKITCTHHQATFLRKTVFEKLGKYNQMYRLCADWALTIKCFQCKELKIKYINKVIAIYSTKGYSNTANDSNPRLRDKNFKNDFISLFEHFSLKDRLQLYMNDYFPKYLNPFKYINFIIRMRRNFSVYL